MRITQAIGGVICTCVRAQRTAHVQMCPFSHLWKGWTECADIWCVVINKLAPRFTKVEGGVRLHVCLFRISGTAGRIALKLGV